MLRACPVLNCNLSFELAWCVSVSYPVDSFLVMLQFIGECFISALVGYTCLRDRSVSGLLCFTHRVDAYLTSLGIPVLISLKQFLTMRQHADLWC